MKGAGPGRPGNMAASVRRLRRSVRQSRVTGCAAGYPDGMSLLARTFTAAVYQEEDWHIAQCLEADVASQGHTIGDALANLAEAVELYLEEIDDSPRT